MAVPLEQEAGTDDLLHDIADFEEILRNEMKSAADDYDRYDRYVDESGTAYEDLTGDIEELFDRAQAAFDLGQYHTARNAYGSLHSMLREEDEYGRSIAPPESVDLDDARARYLHALLMTTAPPERPKCLLGALRDWEQQAGWWRRPTVREVFEVGSISKPEREAILSELVGLLSDWNDLAGDRWLRDATRLLHGCEGIGQLAKLQGCRRPHAYLDRLEEIAAENDPEALLAAARETLGAMPSALPLRAEVADHLYQAAEALGDEKAALAARWEAFQTEPSMTRLLDLSDSAGPSSERREWMRRAAQFAASWKIRREPKTEDKTILTEKAYSPVYEVRITHACSLLLAEEWDQAMGLGGNEPALGWSGNENSQACVLPFGTCQ